MSKDFPKGEVPTVGRIVHFVNSLGECCAAMVTAVNNDVSEKLAYQVNLVAWGATSGATRFNGCDLNPDDHIPGSWHWPERIQVS